MVGFLVGRWALGVVFVIHGLYALNIFPLPRILDRDGQYGWRHFRRGGWNIPSRYQLLDIFSAVWVVLRPNEGRLVWYYLIS